MVDSNTTMDVRAGRDLPLSCNAQHVGRNAPIGKSLGNASLTTTLGPASPRYYHRIHVEAWHMIAESQRFREVTLEWAGSMIGWR